jgi:hypothetical protein
MDIHFACFSRGRHVLTGCGYTDRNQNHAVQASPVIDNVNCLDCLRMLARGVHAFDQPGGRCRACGRAEDAEIHF